MSSRQLVYVYVTLSMIFWGMSFVWSTLVFQCYPPITTVFLRLILSSAFLFLVIRILRKDVKIQRKDIRLLLISSLFNPFLYFMGENFGLKNTSSTISAVIIGTIPVFTAVAAHYAAREKITFLNIIGIILSFTGIWIMLFDKGVTLNASPLGIACLFFAVGSAVVYTLFLRRLSVRYNSLVIIAWQNLIGVFYFLPFFLIFDGKNFLSVRPDASVLGALLMLSIFASSLAYVLYTRSVQVLGITQSNVFTNLIPVFTAIASYFILGESFHFQKIAGMAIVIGGVFISQLHRIRDYYS